MRLQVLGCSGGLAAGVATTAFRVDTDLLIDGGTGVGHLGVDQMRAIRHVFLSHAHLDHLAGLALLIDTAFECLVEAPLTIHARTETIAALRAHVFNDVVWPDFTRLPDPDHGALRLAELATGEPLAVDGRTIEAFEVRHTVPAVGFCCRGAGAGFCFSGDTGPNPGLWEYLNGHETVDALIVEAGFPDRYRELAAHTGHYCPATLADDLARLNYRPRLLVTHLKPGHEAEIMDELAARLPDHDLHRLQDGEIFEL